MAEDREMFGSDAQDVSSTLRDVATGAYILTALAAPSPNLADKSKGLMVGASTMILDGFVSRGLKDLIKRERPNERNDRSMPSGHASIAASRTTMAMRNLEAINMPDWTRQMTNWSLRGVALGSGFARVEANKHYLSDVLVGYALGNFVANFMYNAFMEGDSELPSITFQPAQGGGAFTFTIPVH
ncbi:MAG: phosphatase PAP2 family protein [Pseudomonadales bacterium]